MAEETVTFDEILSDPVYKSEFDRRVTKALSTVQAKLDKEIGSRGTMKTAEEYSAVEKERDETRSSLAAAQAEIEQYKREKLLLSKGVPANDVDYYAFKIGKMVTDSKTFEQAAEDFFKGNNTGKVHVDLGAPLGGGSLQKTANEQMNALIRGALK